MIKKNLTILGLIIVSSILTLLWATVIFPIIYWAFTRKKFAKMIVDLDNYIEDKYIYKTRR